MTRAIDFLKVLENLICKTSGIESLACVAGENTMQTCPFQTQYEIWQESCDGGASGDCVFEVESGEKRWLMLADASGHGPRAAKIADTFRQIVEASWPADLSSERFHLWNRQLLSILPAGVFVAVSIVEIDESKDLVRLPPRWTHTCPSVEEGLLIYRGAQGQHPGSICALATTRWLKTQQSLF